MSPTDLELQAKFADPKTYENWTKEDWDEARRTCLPEEAPTSKVDGYSVPIEYFKYDIDWRRGVREFQEDLGEGRYEPEWQAQAHQAMEERARGDFDNFKEREFEEFWGQKQRRPYFPAGEAAQIKLQELAEQRYIREGDIFSYVRLIRSGKDKILVEKDARVVKIEGAALTMAIPPGRLKFARHLPTPKTTPMKGVKDPSTQEHEDGEISLEHGADTNSPGLQSNGNPTTHPKPVTSMAQNPAGTKCSALDGMKKEPSASVSGNEALHGIGSEEVVSGNVEVSKQTDPADSSPKISHDASDQMDTKDDIARIQRDWLTTAENGTSASAGVPRDPLGGSAEDTGLQPSNLENLLSTKQSRGTPEHQSADHRGKSRDTHSITNHHPTSPSHPLEDVLLHTTTNLTDLERRFVEIDGRLDPKEHRCFNPWLLIRGKRNEQDLGTLFEMREEYYVWKSNRMVKMPKEQVEAAKGKGKGKGTVKVAGTGGVKSKQQKGAETKARMKAEAAAAAMAAEGSTTPAKKTPTTVRTKTGMVGKTGAKRTSPGTDDDDDADSDSEEVMGTPQMTRSGRQVKKRKV